MRPVLRKRLALELELGWSLSRHYLASGTGAEAEAVTRGFRGTWQMRCWTQLELEPRRVVSIQPPTGDQPRIRHLWFHPWPAPRPSPIDPTPFLPHPCSLASLLLRSSPWLLTTPLHFIGCSFLCLQSHPLDFSFIGPRTEPRPHRARTPGGSRVLGLKRGQGAPAALSSPSLPGRSRGGAPPRMRSRSIDLVPDTGRPRSRSCCRSSETLRSGGRRGRARAGSGHRWGVCTGLNIWNPREDKLGTRIPTEQRL